MQETWEMQARSLGQEDPLKESMATHSSVLAWRIPWTEEPGELWSMGSQRVRHDWSDLVWMHEHMWRKSLYFDQNGLIQHAPLHGHLLRTKPWRSSSFIFMAALNSIKWMAYTLFTQFSKMDVYTVSNFPYYNLSWAVEPDYLGSNPISVHFKLVD